MYSMSNGGVYVKAGYASADIGDITQTQNASIASKRTTINSQDNKLEGPMIGIGFQSNELSGGFVAELTTASISLAKTF